MCTEILFKVRQSLYTDDPVRVHIKKSGIEFSFWQDVILAIRDCAFVTSDWPIILSFENHCCRAQQYKLAKYCDEILGDLLLKEPIPESPVNKRKDALRYPHVEFPHPRASCVERK